jgi:hypothetical protein
MLDQQTVEMGLETHLHNGLGESCGQGVGIRLDMGRLEPSNRARTVHHYSIMGDAARCRNAFVCLQDQHSPAGRQMSM